MLESKSFIQTFVLSIAKHLGVSASMLSVNLKLVGGSIEIKFEVTMIGATVSMVHYVTASVKDDGFAPGCLVQIKKFVTILNIDIKIIGLTLDISSVISEEAECGCVGPEPPVPKPAPKPEPKPEPKPAPKPAPKPECKEGSILYTAKTKITMTTALPYYTDDDF